ncbi:MAG: AI-2E family transporter, partial [Paracoccus sp. (in: a-proteobacteria)]
MSDITPPPATLPQTRPETPAPHRAITISTLIAALSLVVLVAAIAFWSHVLLLTFGAILLAIALRAGARALHRLLGLNVKIGVLVVLLAVIGVLAGIVRLAGPAVSEQFSQLIEGIPESWEMLNDWISGTFVGDAVEDQLEDGGDLGGSAAEMAQRLPDLFSTLSGALNATIG